MGLGLKEDTMKLIFAAAVLILFATIGSANAGTAKLSKDFLGAWCDGSTDVLWVGRQAQGRIGWSERGPGQRCDKDTIIFQPHQYIGGEEGWEHACTYTTVKTRFDKSIIATTKTMGVTTTTITANCSDGYCKWQERVMIYFSKGGLFVVETPKFSTQKCLNSKTPL
jgi:hypothetical protein